MKKRLLFLIVICFSLFLNPVYARREYARDKACFSNQRVIQGAIEMYNMDHDVYIGSIDDIGKDNGGYFKPNPNIKGYFKDVTYPDKRCRYRYKSNGKNEQIYCEYHGSPDGTIKPSVEYSWELKRKEFRKFIDILTPIGIVVLWVAAIWAVIPNKKKKEA